VGRNARERARRKAEAKIKGVGAPPPQSHARPVLLMTWGIPGVGKTTFAKWLVKEKGFTRIDSDYPNPLSPLDQMWRQVLANPASLENFVGQALRGGPVVVELGIYAQPGAFDFLRRCAAAGADTWWFDGDRDEAFRAWLQDAPARGMQRERWEEVVRIIRENWQLIEGFFGRRIVRTIEAGPVHIPPEQTYRVIFGA
jgi:AAA domain